MDSTAQASADCFVCRKHRGQIPVSGGAIHDDGLIYVGHAQVSDDQGTAYLGHVLVEPKRHVPGLAELSESEAEAMGRMVTRISRVLKAVEGVVHVYAFVIGDRVDHLHVHLVPRYVGAPREYWGVRVDEWPDAPRGGPDEVAALCDMLRANLSPA